MHIVTSVSLSLDLLSHLSMDVMPCYALDACVVVSLVFTFKLLVCRVLHTRLYRQIVNACHLHVGI
jgi:hypothetical protein